MRDQIRSMRVKLKRENRESFRKLVKLVVCNSLCGVLLKLPNCIMSLNDLRILFTDFNTGRFFDSTFWTSYFIFPYSMGYLCAIAKVCLVFQTFGHFLYLVSVSTNLFFLKKFDKNFTLAFETLFTRKTKTKIKP